MDVGSTRYGERRHNACITRAQAVSCDCKCTCSCTERQQLTALIVPEQMQMHVQMKVAIALCMRQDMAITELFFRFHVAATHLDLR